MVFMKKSARKPTEYVDDDVTPLKRILTLRFPPLILGLILGISLSFITSKFEEVIAKNIAIAFFIPFIVYLADAVGTQTQSIYIRDLRTGEANFKKYLIKESLLGLSIGLIFSLVSAVVIMVWFKSVELTLTVGLSIFIAVLVAPPIALSITEIMSLNKRDPGPGLAQ